MCFQSPIFEFKQAADLLIVWLIVIRCGLIHWLFNKDFDQQIQWIREILFVFNLEESKNKVYAWVDGDICVDLEFRNSLLTQLRRRFNGGSDDTALLPEYSVASIEDQAF